MTEVPSLFRVGMNGIRLPFFCLHCTVQSTRIDRYKSASSRAVKKKFPEIIQYCGKNSFGQKAIV